jgi:hypothetical protein
VNELLYYILDSIHVCPCCLQLILLENVRFYKDEEKNNADFAKKVRMQWPYIPAYGHTCHVHCFMGRPDWANCAVTETTYSGCQRNLVSLRHMIGVGYSNGVAIDGRASTKISRLEVYSMPSTYPVPRGQTKRQISDTFTG